MICAVCQEDKADAQYAPTLNQLVFGGFPAMMQWRCSNCEKQTAETITKMIRSIEGRSERGPNSEIPSRRIP